MTEKILTLHPEGKAGVNIEKAKYNVVKDAILTSLEGTELTFNGLAEAAGEKLMGKFDGSIMWYVTTVKLDLEARGIIERIPKSSPQVLRLPSHSRHTAEYLKERKPTHHIPIVFVDGKEEAVEKTREKVPGGIYTTSAELPVVLELFAKETA